MRALVHDVIPQETLLSTSGLGAMQAIRDGRLPSSPIARHLNDRINAVEAGRVAFRGTSTVEMPNPLGTVHGGWHGTLVESAIA